MCAISLLSAGLNNELKRPNNHLLTCNLGQPAIPNVPVLQPDPNQSVPRMESPTFILHALLVNNVVMAL